MNELIPASSQPPAGDSAPGNSTSARHVASPWPTTITTPALTWRCSPMQATASIGRRLARATGTRDSPTVPPTRAGTATTRTRPTTSPRATCPAAACARSAQSAQRPGGRAELVLVPGRSHEATVRLYGLDERYPKARRESPAGAAQHVPALLGMEQRTVVPSGSPRSAPDPVVFPESGSGRSPLRPYGLPSGWRIRQGPPARYRPGRHEEEARQCLDPWAGRHASRTPFPVPARPSRTCQTAVTTPVPDR